MNRYVKDYLGLIAVAVGITLLFIMNFSIWLPEKPEGPIHHYNGVAYQEAQTIDFQPDPNVHLTKVAEYEAQQATEQFLAEEITCLAVNMYYEARSEGGDGMRAVAAATLNRVASPVHPNTVCDVVFDGCQFSWVCDENIKPIILSQLDVPSLIMYNTAIMIAAEMYSDCNWRAVKPCTWNDPTFGAVNYHTIDVDPSWAEEWREEFTHVTTIGAHRFYVPADKYVYEDQRVQEGRNAAP